MVNMSVRQRYKLFQVSSGMDNGRLEDNSVVKPHILLKNSALDLCGSNGPVELEPYQNCVFSNAKFNPPFLSPNRHYAWA
jgi:hypothetical protein